MPTPKAIPDRIRVYYASYEGHLFSSGPVVWGKKGGVTDPNRVSASIVKWARARRSVDPVTEVESFRLSLLGLDPSSEDPEFEDFPNHPISGLCFVGTDERMTRTVVKVIDAHSVIYDMDLEVFHGALLSTGMGPGGTLNSKFVWYFYNTRAMLIEVGSETHRYLLENPDRVPTKAPGLTSYSLSSRDILKRHDGTYSVKVTSNLS